MLPINMLPTRLARQEVETTTYFLRVPPGITREHVIDPDFWQFTAKRLRLDDEIKISAEDGSLYMLVRVIAIDVRGYWAQVQELIVKEEAAANRLPTAADPDGYKIEHGGKAHGWRIFDRGDNLIEKGLPTREAAAVRLAEIKAEKRAA